jgi:hypothetical protein
MSSRKLIARWLLLLLASTAVGQQEQRYIVLPLGAGNLGSIRLFSDDTHLGTWAPNETEVNSLEANLSQVSEMKPKLWNISIRIDHPESYYRQYIGATVKRKRLIYVNAFCNDPPPQTWKSQLYIVSDGGTCFWQAFYDPATKQFLNLTINGRA